MKKKFVRQTIARNAEGGLGKVQSHRAKFAAQKRAPEPDGTTRHQLRALAAKARKTRLAALLADVALELAPD